MNQTTETPSTNCAVSDSSVIDFPNYYHVPNMSNKVQNYVIIHSMQDTLVSLGNVWETTMPNTIHAVFLSGMNSRAISHLGDNNKEHSQEIPCSLLQNN
jgi:hypothetical protein